MIDFFHPTILLTVLRHYRHSCWFSWGRSGRCLTFGHSYTNHCCCVDYCGVEAGTWLCAYGGRVLGAVGIYFLSFNLPYSPSPFGDAAIIELGLLVVFGVLVGLYVRWVIGPIRRRSKLTGPEAMIGKTGVAITDLKPKGEVRVAGEIWRAESLSGDIDKRRSSHALRL